MRTGIPLAILVVTLSAAHGRVQASCVDPPSSRAPLQDLKECTVGADVDAALEECQDGCNLYFPAGTYPDAHILIDDRFPDGFTMYGDGMGQTILLAPTYTFNAAQGTHTFYPIIEVIENAPDGIIIRDMTLDGRRKEQNTPTNPQRCYTHGEDPPGEENHAGIHFCDEDAISGTCWHALVDMAGGIYTGVRTTMDIRQDGVIRNVEAKEMLGSTGIRLREVEGWTVEDNWVHNIGCHDIDAHCSNLAFTPSPIPGSSPVEDYEPADCWVDHAQDRWTQGFGIAIDQNCSDILVEGNEIGRGGFDTQYGATKDGLVTYHSEGLGCAPASPTDITFRSNTVNRCGSGATLNGGCRIIFESNTVRDSRASGLEGSNVGFGFGCNDGGEDSEWHDNISEDNQAAGFYIRCRQGGLLFEGNLSTNNCLFTEHDFGDLHFFGREPSEAPSCMVVAETESYSSKCWAGMNIGDFTDVTVTESRMEAGTKHGLRFRDVNGLEVLDSDFLDSGTPVLGAGIQFDAGITNAYIQLVDMGIDPPIGPVDGSDCLNHDESVAYCPQEPGCGEPDPECCDNVGSSNDPTCPDFGSCYECPANESPPDCGGPGCHTTQPPEECPAVLTGSHGCFLQDDGVWLECASNEEMYLVTCDCESIPPGNLCQASTSFVDCQ